MGKGHEMPFKIIPLLLLLSAPAHATGTEPAAKVVERAVALVGDSVITSTDVKLHTALRALDPSFIPVLSSEQGPAEEQVISSTIIRQMAGQVPVYQPKPGQVQSRLERFKEQWSSDRDYANFLAIHGLTERRLEAVLKRRATIERVVIRALGAPKDNPTQWAERFEEWMRVERKGVRVRTIPKQEGP